MNCHRVLRYGNCLLAIHAVDVAAEFRFIEPAELCHVVADRRAAGMAGEFLLGLLVLLGDRLRGLRRRRGVNWLRLRRRHCGILLRQAEFRRPIEGDGLMQLGDASRQGFEGVLTDELRHQQRVVALVNCLVDELEDLVVLDDRVHAVDHGLRAADAGAFRDEDKTLQVGLDGEAEPRRQLDRAGVEELSQDQDVLGVLLDRRRDAVGLAAEEGSEFAVLVDGNAFGKVLALADPHFQEAVNQQMVDLGDQPAGLDPQIMDDHPVLGFAPMDLHLVSRFGFAAGPGLDIPDFLIDPILRVGGAIGAGQQRFQDIQRGILVVGFFDDHRVLYLSYKSLKG